MQVCMCVCACAFWICDRCFCLAIVAEPVFESWLHFRAACVANFKTLLTKSSFECSIQSAGKFVHQPCSKFGEFFPNVMKARKLQGNNKY